MLGLIFNGCVSKADADGQLYYDYSFGNNPVGTPLQFRVELVNGTIEKLLINPVPGCGGCTTIYDADRVGNSTLVKLSGFSLEPGERKNYLIEYENNSRGVFSKSINNYYSSVNESGQKINEGVLKLRFNGQAD
jgi:hypothetical protein